MYFQMVACSWCTEHVNGKEVSTEYFPALAHKRVCPTCGSWPETPYVTAVLDLTLAESRTIEEKQYLVYLRYKHHIERIHAAFDHLLQLEGPSHE
jgi:hypothetical protein